MRLDIYLMEKNMVKSRERGKELIKNQQVLVDGKVISKASADINDTQNVSIIGEQLKYVGRGGLKLESAINNFSIDLKGKICMNVGASTGGFTDCMLKNNAAKVYAIDVGQGQLDESLINDKKVINLEKTNINDVDSTVVTDKIDFFSVDVSFVSIKNILQTIWDIIPFDTCGVVLIKPQFEVGRGNIGKNGIVKDKKVHYSIVAEMIATILSFNFSVLGLIESPITGGDGNIEYLCYIKKSENPMLNNQIDAKKIVDFAFLKKKG